MQIPPDRSALNATSDYQRTFRRSLQYRHTPGFTTACGDHLDAFGGCWLHRIILGRINSGRFVRDDQIWRTPCVPFDCLSDAVTTNKYLFLFSSLQIVILLLVHKMVTRKMRLSNYLPIYLLSQSTCLSSYGRTAFFSLTLPKQIQGISMQLIPEPKPDRMLRTRIPSH
jgi:hypothetical protein